MVRISGSLKQGVADLVKTEQASIPRQIGFSAEDAAISRAAHGGARLALAVAEQQASLAGQATLMGGQLDLSRPDQQHRSRYIKVRVSEEERERFGYGELPDQLIADVIPQIGKILPEYVDSTAAYRLAARTMHLVRQQPHIDSVSLHTGLSEWAATEPLSGRVSPHEAAVFGGVVCVAHELTRGYLEEKQAAAVTTASPMEVVNG